MKSSDNWDKQIHDIKSQCSCLACGVELLCRVDIGTERQKILSLMTDSARELLKLLSDGLIEQ